MNAGARVRGVFCSMVAIYSNVIEFAKAVSFREWFSVEVFDDESYSQDCEWKEEYVCIC